MKYSIKSGSLDKFPCGCLVLGYYEKTKLTPSAKHLDHVLNGSLTRILKRGDAKGKVGQTLMLNDITGAKAQRILLVGLGSTESVQPNTYRKAISSVIKQLKLSGAKNAIVALSEIDVEARDNYWKAKQLVEICEDGVYQFTQMKSSNGENLSLTNISIFIDNQKSKSKVDKGITHGAAVAHGVNLAKDLSNLPGNVCTPTYLAKQAQSLKKSHRKLTVKVLTEAQMEKLGMGSLLSVSRGSRQPAKLIIMEYKGASAKKKPYVLVGKGLTFDAGGISLKPAAAMDEMKYDMCGGASVFGTVAAVTTLNLPINVVGIVPSSENLPDGDANKPGDIVTSMSGKTIEILNTDAEGRLILCDALTYAERYKPETIIDIATLTGACIIALGKHPSGMLGNDDDLCDALEMAGDNACDRVWRLPLWDDYQSQLKSNFADMANIGGRDAGTITAACFLSRFTEEYKWAHLDIAGTAWRSGGAKGATGRPVPLLVQYLLDRC